MLLAARHVQMQFPPSPSSLAAFLAVSEFNSVSVIYMFQKGQELGGLASSSQKKPMFNKYYWISVYTELIDPYPA
jgi:hypothetical protein